MHTHTHTQVRYDLLDCNKFFLDSVNRILNLMETGNVKGGAQLVPHLFQFLVLLANDSSKLVSIPEVLEWEYEKNPTNLYVSF